MYYLLDSLIKWSIENPIQTKIVSELVEKLIEHFLTKAGTLLMEK